MVQVHHGVRVSTHGSKPFDSPNKILVLTAPAGEALVHAANARKYRRLEPHARPWRLPQVDTPQWPVVKPRYSLYAAGRNRAGTCLIIEKKYVLAWHMRQAARIPGTRDRSSDEVLVNEDVGVQDAYKPCGAGAMDYPNVYSPCFAEPERRWRKYIGVAYYGEKVAPPRDRVTFNDYDVIALAGVALVAQRVQRCREVANAIAVLN